MPIRNKVSDAITDPRFDQNPQDPARNRGRPIVVTFIATNLIDDDSGSTFYLCDIPADAILDRSTSFFVTNWGYATINIGTRTLTTALVNAGLRTANIINPITIGDTRHGLPAWQQLGLAAAPADNNISLFCHAPANATVAGNLRGEVVYRHH
jgi:hypothetical protein